MGLPTSPPQNTVYSTRKGSTGWPVYALQAGLNHVLAPAPGLIEDGDFGPKTEGALIDFQRGTGLTADGIAGPATQGKIANIAALKTEDAVTGTPVGFLRGLMLAESGNLLGAVNWSVPGGVDCGLVQIRVYGGPYDPAALKDAFHPLRSAKDAAADFDSRRDSFLDDAWVDGSRERAGRCAALAHNWPAGAASQARYGRVPSPTAMADWVPEGVRFPDGQPVRTRQEWAEFYALGGPHGPGMVTRFVTRW